MAAAAPVVSAEGKSLMHSCWTYWGHSGAPLFDELGRVCGLHSSWDDRSGMRHAQMLARLHAALAAGERSRSAGEKKERDAMRAREDAKLKCEGTREQFCLCVLGVVCMVVCVLFRILLLCHASRKRL